MKAKVLLFIPEDIVDNTDLEPYNYHRSGPLEHFLEITVEVQEFDRQFIVDVIKAELQDILLRLELEDVTKLPLTKNLVNQIKHIEEIHDDKQELRASLNCLEQLVSPEAVDRLADALYQSDDPTKAIKTISDDYLREFLLEYFADQLSKKKVPIIFNTGQARLPEPSNTKLPSSTERIELHDKEDKQHYPAEWSKDERVMVVPRMDITMIGEYLEIERMNSGYDLINNYLEDGTDIYWNIKERLEANTDNIKTQIVDQDVDAVAEAIENLQELSDLLAFADNNLLIPLDQTTKKDLKAWARGENMESVVSRYQQHENEFVGKRTYPPKTWLKEIQPINTIRESRKKIREIRDRSSNVSSIIANLVQDLEEIRRKQERWDHEKRLQRAKELKEYWDLAINATIKLAEFAQKL